MSDTVEYVTNDPFTLQAKVKAAYLLREQGLLTDREFCDVVGEVVRKTTNLT